MDQSIYQRTALGQQEIIERELKMPSRARTLLLLIESHDLNQLDKKIAHPDHFDILLHLGLITKTETSSNVQKTISKPTIQQQDLNLAVQNSENTTSTTFSRLRSLTDKISQNLKSTLPQKVVQNNDEIIEKPPHPHIKKIENSPPINNKSGYIQQNTSKIDASLPVDLIENSTLNINTNHQPKINEKKSEADLPLLSFIEIRHLMQETLKQYCGLMAKHLIQAIAQSQTPQELRHHQKKWLTDLFETRISREQLTTLKNHINLSLQEIEKENFPKN